MKRVSLLALAVFFTIVSKGQVWFDLGIKGGYTPGMSLNTNIFNDEGYQINYAHSYLFGGKIGINFSPEHSITIDGLLTTINNSRTVTNDELQQDLNLSLRYFELPILYRFNKENGGYSEVGPQIGFFQGATVNDQDASEQFNKTNYGLAVGMGQYIGGGNLFGLNLGVRIAYMFNDIITPDFKGTEGNAVYAPSLANESFAYKASSNLYAGDVAEFNFNFGYFVKGSGCHKNTRFKLF